MIDIEIANRQNTVEVDERRLATAVREVLDAAGIERASVSVAVVDDPQIHALNRLYLNHDYPTDVLSFLLDAGETHLEGEVIISADTAAASAARFGWKAADELLLYVIHGALHLVGYDDQTSEERSRMRSQEAAILARIGLTPRYDE